jgi:hypothetical protein
MLPIFPLTSDRVNPNREIKMKITIKSMNSNCSATSSRAQLHIPLAADFTFTHASRDG